MLWPQSTREECFLKMESLTEAIFPSLWITGLDWEVAVQKDGNSEWQLITFIPYYFKLFWAKMINLLFLQIKQSSKKSFHSDDLLAGECWSAGRSPRLSPSLHLSFIVNVTLLAGRLFLENYFSKNIFKCLIFIIAENSGKDLHVCTFS